MMAVVRVAVRVVLLVIVVVVVMVVVVVVAVVMMVVGVVVFVRLCLVAALALREQDGDDAQEAEPGLQLDQHHRPILWALCSVLLQ